MQLNQDNSALETDPVSFSLGDFLVGNSKDPLKPPAAFAWVVVATLRLFLAVATVSDPFAGSLAAGVLAMWVMESAQLLLYPKTSIFHIPAYMGASVALVLAEAATEKFGGDSVEELRRNAEGYLKSLVIS